MGDDEDDHDHTGQHGKYPSVGDRDAHDKPKYKRQEFMRPKYGAVNFDVIDTVNARLAAAVASAGGTNDIFSKLKIETSLDNDNKKIGEVEGTFQVPTDIAKKQNGTQEHVKSSHHKRHKTVPPNIAEKNSKNNHSLTLSSGKRYSKKVSRATSTVEQTYAQADTNTGANSQLKAATIASRCQGSFDDVFADGEELQNVSNRQTEKSDNNATRPSIHCGNTNSKGVPNVANSSASHVPSYNIRLFTAASTSGPAVTSQTAPAVSVSSQNPVTPSVARTLFTAPQATSVPKTNFRPGLHAMVPTSSAVQTASTSLMMHFKNLVNVSLNSLRIHHKIIEL
ncbi:unnamed protein product [Thelazia callipaeda]|uniref:HUN domain-containing protein n=1 Tax=Thelazia callipaeda TaxID=103827 RepID=A0A0N5CR90_THECL|nr:unnamed protein product [Thelazia callipaeda]